MSNGGYNRSDLDPVVDTGKTAVERTKAAIKTKGWGPGRIDQAKSFLRRAKKSDARRKQEKASRKANRKR